MSRSDWGILTALAGLAALVVAFGTGLYLASLNYPHEQRYQPYRYTAEQPAKVEPATTGQPNPQPLQYRTPCSQPEGQGESDLCAQWRAAIAAEKAAKEAERATDWAIVATILSALGLIAIVWSLMQTERTLKLSGRANEAQSRPWVYVTGFNMVKATNINLNGDMVVSGLLFSLKFENKGNSPAYPCRSRAAYCVTESGCVRPNFPDQELSENISLATHHPVTSRDHPFYGQEAAGLLSGDLDAWALVRVEYGSPLNPARTYVTECAYRVWINGEQSTDGGPFITRWTGSPEGNQTIT